jgi:Spy/CpxP family protein refolding chaperone
MKKSLGVILVATTILSAGAMMVLAAAPEGSEVEGRHGAGQGRLVEYLGLSEEQQAAWKSLREQHKTEMEPFRQEGRDLHARLRAAMKADNPDPATVGSAVLALKQHREKAEAARMAFHSRLAGVLNDEQKAKFEALSAHRPGRWGGHWGPGAPRTSS